MNKTSCFFVLFVMTTFLLACKSTRQSQTSTPSTMPDSLFITLDTMVVKADEEWEPAVEKEYQATRERKWDLLHTKLDLAFDWKNETVMGTATLTLTPLFYEQSVLEIDAVNFDVQHLTVNEKHLNSYGNTGRVLVIPLDRKYKKGEEVIVDIDYKVQPRATALTPGGAITSNKGLFFIDPQDTIPGKPQQIWTQGETQYSSQWFPTIDSPNERGTQEIILTVSDTMMTLSNGLLVASESLSNGMRRDHWKLDIPHAPYLAMIAVGQWDREVDYWRGRTVDYYVDPGYGPSARTIFQHTPEMIEFFSKVLKYDFVWPKYSQVIVKDFVTGAMENSSAVIYGDFVQFNKDHVFEEGINDYIVAHELFHQWFGDVVTCESWSHLALNEGFANYGEYLWQEFKYGREQADLTRLNELSGYFDQAENEVHPLIDFYYDEAQDMFDAHSYNKGGLVLHMLRDMVGDEAFYASLNRYLKRNEFQAVEVDDLRKAFEDVTGKDLRWFFDQWYFGLGHPVLNISHTYLPEKKQLQIDVEQVQAEEGYTDRFILPFEVAVLTEYLEIFIEQLRLTKVSQRFVIDVPSVPSAVIIDPRDILLAVVHHDMPSSEYPIRSLAPVSINHRLSAFRLIEEPGDDLIETLLTDPSYTMRLLAINHLIEEGETNRVYQAAKFETNPEIQYYAMQALFENDPAKAKDIAIKLLEKTKKVPIIYDALMVVAEEDIDEAVHWLAHFESNTSEALYVARAFIRVRNESALSLDFFMTDEAAQISDDYLEDLIAAMALWLSDQPQQMQAKGLEVIESPFYLQSSDSEYRRFYLITGLLPQYVQEDNMVYREMIRQTINNLYQKESNPYLKNVLKEGLGDLLD